MGVFGGLSDSYDGPSHHAMEDLAIMRTLPNVRVLCASDAIITDWMVQEAIESTGPMYIRLSREAVPYVHKADRDFKLGKGVVVREGKDATIIACGIMVSKALEAAELLAQKGIDIRVIDMFTLKPIDVELIKKCAVETGVIFTAEEHSTIGGLGSAVAEVAATLGFSFKLHFIGIHDHYTETGSFNELIAKYGLDSKGIAEKILKAMLK